MENPDGELRPGMFAVARSTRQPATAGRSGFRRRPARGAQWVFVQDGPGRFRRIAGPGRRSVAPEWTRSPTGSPWPQVVANALAFIQTSERRHRGMIHASSTFALRKPLAGAEPGVGLLVWGIISFHNLPIEAYPDVADTYVKVITQWPGHAAEEVEQQITVPLEVQLNGVAHLTHLRSISFPGSRRSRSSTTTTPRPHRPPEKFDRLSQVTLPPA